MTDVPEFNVGDVFPADDPKRVAVVRLVVAGQGLASSAAFWDQFFPKRAHTAKPSITSCCFAWGSPTRPRRHFRQLDTTEPSMECIPFLMTR